MFKTIEITGWRQFEGLRVEFDRNVTILTGVNGTGKTTILNILSKHFGWNFRYTSLPSELSEKTKHRLLSDFWKQYDFITDVRQNMLPIGKIVYYEGNTCTLQVLPSEQTQYDISYAGQKSIVGLHIPSHRPVYNYHKIDSIPTDPKTSAQQYQEYQQFLMQIYQSPHVQNPGRVLKASILSLATFGYDSQVMVGNAEYRHLFEGFQEILHSILPKNIGFLRLQIRNSEIALVTSSGTFPFDSISGGLSSLIGIAWQVFMFGADKTEYVITIDEPENHLHPSMQRELIPKLSSAFPNCQFIIATHSPFIASSMREAKVYAFKYNDENHVHAEFLDFADKSGNATDILRDVLDVPITVPIWVEEKLSDIANRYASKGITEESYAVLRSEMESLNLASLLPLTLAKMMEKKK